MHLKHAVAALAMLSSLVAAAPAQDAKRADRAGQNQDQKQNQNNNNNNGKNNGGQNRNNGNNNNNKGNGKGDVTIIQNINKPNIIVVQENVDKINDMQRQNERELAALVQAQLALAAQLQTVKDNIRVNHFKAQFPQANVVIVTVTGLVDNRGQGQGNQRYLVNQLLADNGRPDKQMLVMVMDPTPLQLSTPKAASSKSDFFGAARVAMESDTATILNRNANFSATTASATDSTVRLAAFDQAAPFGQVGQSVILPAGTQAPQLSLSVPDPAAIILPNQQSIFVESAGSFLSDCASSAANAASSNPALAGAAANIFSSFQQIAAAQLAGLSGLGIFNNSGQVQAGGVPLGAIAVGANQGQAIQSPAQVAIPPQAAPIPPAAILAGANQGQGGQPAAAVSPPSGAAPQPPAAILAGANQAPPAAVQPPLNAAAPASPAAVSPGALPAAAQPIAAVPPQGNTGSGVLIIGSSPGGAAASTPAAQPPAVLVSGANQAPPAQPVAVSPAQGNRGSGGSGVVVIGSSPGGAAALIPAAQPPAVLVAGAKQAQPAIPSSPPPP
ncbi:hypothetical protein C8034_v007645 [Colletotrichum sidae]|uniref:Cas1p-like protein n=1 Tax=Colletotrichum sidae TaxID=1347389 RepID=A0A4R8TSW0_9PEZI|nr:hypothetical protein C8034_v007645 [Colletotrichum sidae]